jgi:hypothetical protein
MVTPVIGNEFTKGTCNIVDDILRAPDAEKRIRDLAIMSKSSGLAFGLIVSC